VLSTAIDELPADYRAVVLLRDVEGLSQQETAEALGLTVVSVKSRLHRARLFLRKRLDARLAVSGRSVRRPTLKTTKQTNLEPRSGGGAGMRSHDRWSLRPC